MDIWIFCDKFNQLNDTEVIERSKITSEVMQDGKRYDIFIATANEQDKVLLTLYSDKSGSINKCIVTAGRKNPGYPFEDFRMVSNYSAAVLMGDEDEAVSEILDKLGFSSYASRKKIDSSYYDTVRFNYSLTANESGIAFVIENNLLCDKTAEPLTLRRKD